MKETRVELHTAKSQSPIICLLSPIISNLWLETQKKKKQQTNIVLHSVEQFPTVPIFSFSFLTYGSSFLFIPSKFPN